LVAPAAPPSTAKDLKNDWLKAVSEQLDAFNEDKVVVVWGIY